MIDDFDTIAAISTPAGSGGLAVIRVSGSKAVEIVCALFEGRPSLDKATPRTAYLGKFFSVANDSRDETRELLDEVIVILFRAPNSYTAEDVLEISCHGGAYIANRILQAVTERGARLARPGEFTQRAFLNGRLDLSQAEAVADLIGSKTAASLNAAIAQFQGGLGDRVRDIRGHLVDICSMVELELDFAEEDVEFADKKDIVERVKSVISEIASFILTYQRGRILREGVKLVIVGAPNVGKSSLLNTLLKEERAIVTDVAGTTRDSLEEQLDIRGHFFRIVDTAGIRATEDAVEKLGIERTYKHVKEADVIVFLFDGSRVLLEEDRSLVSEVSRMCGALKDKCVAVINKCDLKQNVKGSEIKSAFALDVIVEISALRHEGLPMLEKALLSAAQLGLMSETDEPVISSLRQKNALDKGLVALKKTLDSLDRGLSGEFIALDLREAIACLGAVIGDVTTEDILENIFSRFCIGK